MIRKDVQIIVHAKINTVWLFYKRMIALVFCGDNVIKESPHTWSIQQA